jgi:hypothetical protein
MERPGLPDPSLTGMVPSGTSSQKRKMRKARSMPRLRVFGRGSGKHKRSTEVLTGEASEKRKVEQMAQIHESVECLSFLPSLSSSPIIPDDFRSSIVAADLHNDEACQGHQKKALQRGKWASASSLRARRRRGSEERYKSVDGLTRVLSGLSGNAPLDRRLSDWDRTAPESEEARTKFSRLTRAIKSGFSWRSIKASVKPKSS